MIITFTVSQVANQTVPRHLRFAYVETTDFGVGLSAADSSVDTGSLYGTGARSGDNSGIRQYYEYGLWSKLDTFPCPTLPSV